MKTKNLAKMKSDLIVQLLVENGKLKEQLSLSRRINQEMFSNVQIKN